MPQAAANLTNTTFGNFISEIRKIQINLFNLNLFVIIIVSFYSFNSVIIIHC